MNDQKTIIIGLTLALILGLGLWYISQNSTEPNQAALVANSDEPANQNSNNPNPNQGQNDEPAVVINLDNQAVVDINNYSDPYLGDPNAPVAILEYFSYGCGHCHSFHQTTFNQIKQNYIDTGKVKIMSRQLFGIDQLAEAGLCAGEQGKFWEYHSVLFDRSSEFASESDLDKLKTIAADLGLDTVKFSDCYDNSRFASAVQQWSQDGQAAGINGVPAFYVNDSVIMGNQPYEKFVEAIEAELNK